MNCREFIKNLELGIMAVNTLGILPGEKVFAAENLSVKTWLGIPYAKPPIKNLRWQAPQKLNPTNKSFDAKNFGFTAVQIIDDKEPVSKNPQSEDCLTLNIWKKSDKKNLPVMVWIHGGG